MEIKMEVKEGKALAEKFRHAGKEAQNKIDKALLKAGYLVERTAKIYQTPHVDTGRLRASIATRLVPRNAQVGTNVVYARRIEFGFKGDDSLGRTYNQAAYPFLKPALKDKEMEIKMILHKGLTEFIKDNFKGFTKVF